MKNRILAIVVIALLAIQFLPYNVFIANSYAQTTPSVYVGIDIAYGATEEAKATIDQVSSYTNLVVFGSTEVTWFQDRVNETFQYAYDKGLSIISLRPALPEDTTEGLNETEWYSMAQNRWGERLLGFYILDEPGGKQLDGTAEYGWNNFTGYPSNYVNAANMFTEGVSTILGYERPPAYYETFTSDYALYWYDYKAGYDTIFAQFGWNYSREINIALCRGAAEKQNKDWGVIITWTYTNSPYMESGDQLYNDMVLAYDSGAKYIIVFDSDEEGHSVLQAEHLDAIQRFWNYAKNNPSQKTLKSERTAYVLPNAYGFGFRWPTDHIWGVWEADELTSNISRSVGALLDQYGTNLDIIYDDDLQQGNNGYNQLIYWNSYDPTPTPSPTPTPTPSPTPTPTASPDNTLTEFSLTALLIATIIVSTTVVSGFVIFHFKKKSKSNNPLNSITPHKQPQTKKTTTPTTNHHNTPNKDTHK